MASTNKPKRLVVFCDGTWCGRETGTTSNIQMLAEMVGPIQFDTSPKASPVMVHPIQANHANTVAGYQEGIGLNKTFLEYIWDGATASTIAEECIAVYRFIVEHFTLHHEIWLFGLSRGAYTVRCVTGMINNCGIIKPLADAEETGILCEKVYQIYRSPLETDRPDSARCKDFRKNTSVVWQVKTPVKFMGLLDTVGSMGIPRINAGVGFDWPEFYDQEVSSVVEKVYHAQSLHDRLWAFEPCMAFRSKKYTNDPKFKIEAVWFPGCHYDLGRQAFRFVRSSPKNQLEKWLGVIPDRLAKPIYPNEILSDVVLVWMLEGIRRHDSGRLVVPNVDSEILNANTRIVHPTSAQPTGPAGSGDVYGDIISHAPAGTLFSSISALTSKFFSALNFVTPNLQLGDSIQDLLGIKTILRILTATRDRRVPDGTGEANVLRYKASKEVDLDGGRTEEVVIGDLAKVDKKRYPSQTFESFLLWRRVFGST